MADRNQLHLVGIFAGISGFIFFWSQIFVWFAAPSHQTLPFGHAPAHDQLLRQVREVAEGLGGQIGEDSFQQNYEL